MTQQNETEQQPAGPEQPAAATQPPQPAPSGPAYPSPYLDAGESVPQAYLAPPQPGQPRFGASPSGQGGRPGGGALPRYGQPPAARLTPVMSGAARRDPALAAAWHRLAASSLDWAIIIVASLLAFWSPLSRIWGEAQAIAIRYPDLSSPAAHAAMNSISANPANQRITLYWLTGMFGIALVYFWLQHAVWGATVGKRALGVRVLRAADRSRIGVRQAGIRTVAFLTGPALVVVVVQAVALLGGSAVSAVLVYGIYLVGGVLWAADGGLLLLNSQAQSLHDKLAGTIVVRQRWLDRRSRGSQPW